MEDLDALKSNLEDYIRSKTRTNSKDEYICPLCGSGSGRNHKTGKGDSAFKFLKDGKHAKCFSSRCGFYGDIYDWCREIEYSNLSLEDGKSAATKRIIELYGRNGIAPKSAKKPVKQPTAEKKPIQFDYSPAIARYKAALQESPEALLYLADRGFTPETVERFNLGYNAANNSIVIPYNRRNTYYSQRLIGVEGKGKYHKLDGVVQPIFNRDALYAEGNDVVFVTEGELCAISIMQEGGQAIALSGNGFNKLLEQLSKKPTKAIIALCLDNDDVGRDAVKKAKEKLSELNKTLPLEQRMVCADAVEWIMGSKKKPDAEDGQAIDYTKDSYKKDPNDVLRYNPEGVLHEAIANAVKVCKACKEDRDRAIAAQQQEALEEEQAAADEQQQAEEQAEEERKQRTGAERIEAFLRTINTRQYEPMPTGIKTIDEALNGGFMRRQLVVLGAAPGMGKTALAMWMFERMAANGTSCLFLNLEMHSDQLLARSFSAALARAGHKMNATQVLRGYAMSEEQWAAVEEVAEYEKVIASNMVMNPVEVTSNLSSILEYMNAEAERAKKLNQKAPIVILDFLQKVTGEPNEDKTAVIQRAIAAFKEYALNHETIVFMIVANNRDANKNGKILMEAARDTSDIEYTADIQLGMAYTKCLKPIGRDEKTNRDIYPAPTQISKEDKRYLTLQVLKGRFGGQDAKVELYFDGETMTFSEVGADFTPYNGKTPFDTTASSKPLRF